MTTNHTELCRVLSYWAHEWMNPDAAAACKEARDMIESKAARIADLENECAALIHDNARLLRIATAEATLASEALAERDALKVDAERYRWAIASDENATALYAAVFSCGPNAKNSIDAEMDAAIQAKKETR